MSEPADSREALSARLRERYGDAWQFELRVRGALEREKVVEGELVAGARQVVRSVPFDTGRAAADSLDTLGVELFEACVEALEREPATAAPLSPETVDYSAIDPVTLRVVGGAFNAVAHEMAHVLYRMSYSSIIRESEDLGCGLFDAQGRELCESESSPMHIGSLPAYIRGFSRTLRGEFHEGDIILHNHPYLGASHTPDMCVATPLFADGQLLGFAAATAHLVDIGAAAPGLNVDLIDVYAEGLLFNAVKLYDRGRRNAEVWKLLQDSVRTPEMNAADIEAMIAAVRLGKDRFEKLVARYGMETVLGTAYYWMDYSERRLRAEIEKVPDGDYHAESWLDDDGRNWGRRLKVNVTVRVRGSDVTIDLTGSADEVETAFNVPFEGSLLVACYYVIRTLMLDEAMSEEFIPQNEGMFRPVSVVAPKGSIFNPNFPRACFSRMAQVQRLIDCVIQALAPVLPERVTAGNSASVMSISYSGFEQEKQQYWVCVEVNEGSYGGRLERDGLDCVDNLMANTRNVPAEEIEMHYPLRVERYELRPDPPGAGRTRGGIGVTREVRFLRDGFISSNGDRHTEAPRGLFGGNDGLTGRLVRNPHGEAPEDMPSKLTGRKMRAGDVIRYVGPSSGGYGDPRERDPRRVLDDWRDGYIALADAREVYGVVIDPAARQVDEEATRRLRAGAG